MIKRSLGIVQEIIYGNVLHLEILIKFLFSSREIHLLQ